MAVVGIWLLLAHVFDRPTDEIDSIVSALAFTAFIVTIFLQMKELSLQRDALTRSANAQEELANQAKHKSDLELKPRYRFFDGHSSGGDSGRIRYTFKIENVGAVGRDLRCLGTQKDFVVFLDREKPFRALVDDKWNRLVVEFAPHVKEPQRILFDYIRVDGKRGITGWEFDPKRRELHPGDYAIYVGSGSASLPVQKVTG